MWSHLSSCLGKWSLPTSLSLSAQFIFLQLQEWGLHFLAGCQLEALAVCRLEVTSVPRALPSALPSGLPTRLLASSKAAVGKVWVYWWNELQLITYTTLITYSHHLCRILSKTSHRSQPPKDMDNRRWWSEDLTLASVCHNTVIFPEW